MISQWLRPRPGHEASTYADVAAKTSIFRALVIRARASAKQVEKTTIMPIFKESDSRTKRTTMDRTGRMAAITVVRRPTIVTRRFSS